MKNIINVEVITDANLSKQYTKPKLKELFREGDAIFIENSGKDSHYAILSGASYLIRGKIKITEDTLKIIWRPK